MAESGVIREFLVALGFRIDQPALQSFEQGIHKAGRAAIGLASAVEGMALTVGLGISRFASNLEQLYFAAHRTGSSAVALRAFQRTAQDFGASAGEALGSVEGLAQSMRTNPGNVALLEGLGVHLKRTKDGTYDAADALMQFGDVMRKRGYFKPGQFYIAEQYARMLGINERTLLALRNGKFDAEYKRIHGRMKHHGFDKAAADAHRFMNSLRSLETVLQVFGAQVEDAIQKKLGMNLKQLSAWIEKHGPGLATVLVKGALELYHVAAWLGEKLVWLIPKFERLDEDTHGWAGKLVALYAVLRLIGGLEVISGVMRLSAAFLTLGSRILGVRAAAAGASAVSAGGLAGALVPGSILGVLAGWGLDKAFPNNPLDQFGKWIGTGLEKFRDRRGRLLDYFTSQGWSPWQAAGIVARLQDESGLLDNAIGDKGKAYGVAQWHKARQEEFERVMGRPLVGSSLMQQAAFTNYELRNDPEYGGKMLADATTARKAARIFTKYFERPANVQAQEAKTAAGAEVIYRQMVAKDPVLSQVQARFAHDHMGATLAAQRAERLARMHAGAPGAVTLNQHTEVHVAGTGGAAETAHEVAGQQRRVNADLVRNFAMPVR
jgi:hypothetical protein